MGVKMITLDTNALATLRKGKEMSQSELARRAGIARATVNRLESGQADAVTFATINRIAEALGIDADAFVTFEREKKRGRKS